MEAQEQKEDVNMHRMEVAKLSRDLEQAFYKVMITDPQPDYYGLIHQINQISAKIIDRANIIYELQNLTNGQQESI